MSFNEAVFSVVESSMLEYCMWSSHASSLVHSVCVCMIQDWLISGYLK